MPEALITISISRVKDGRIGDFKRINREIIDAVREHEPRMVGMHVFANEDGSEAVGVQFHPDSESMEFHLKIMKEKIGQAMDFLELTDLMVLGAAGSNLAGMMAELQQGATNVKHLPQHVSGFTRSSPA